MAMRKVKLPELSDEVRRFLDQVKNNEGLLIEDADGRARYGVIPYQQVSQAEKEATLARLKTLQDDVGKMMRETGKTEAELDAILQNDG